MESKLQKGREVEESVNVYIPWCDNILHGVREQYMIWREKKEEKGEVEKEETEEKKKQKKMKQKKKNNKKKKNRRRRKINYQNLISNI